MKYKHYMDRTLIYIKCNNHSYNTICDKNLIGAFRVHFHGKAITAELSPNKFFRNIFFVDAHRLLISFNINCILYVIIMQNYISDEYSSRN